jgi:hypothetical protein
MLIFPPEFRKYSSFHLRDEMFSRRQRCVETYVRVLWWFSGSVDTACRLHLQCISVFRSTGHQESTHWNHNGLFRLDLYFYSRGRYLVFMGLLCNFSQFTWPSWGRSEQQEIGVLVYLFLFDDRVTNADYKASNVEIINEWIGKDVEGNDNSLIWYTVQAFAWWDLRKPWNILVRVTGLRAWFEVRDFPIAKQEATCATILTGSDILIGLLCVFVLGDETVR